ncbi:MAG: xanthine dehydrogenase family protein molybdopterin-binding subunit [Haloarculaceae archaeon]
MPNDTSGSTGSGAGPSADTETGDDRLVGQGITRREDRALLTGNTRYTDDISVPGMTHVAFVRSDRAHARVEGIDTARAETMDGVLAVYTWDDLAASDSPCVLPVRSGPLDCDPPGHPVLARDRVRYQGQPVAVVVAADRYRARDGARAVAVAYDPFDTVVDAREATGEEAPTLFEDAPNNVALTATLGDPGGAANALGDADHVVERDLRNNRLIASAIEPRAAVADWDAGDERLTVEMTSQSPHGHRSDLSSTLGLPERQIRVVAPDVGGGFGHKGHHHPGEAMVGWASMRLDRPVKWTARRSANYLEGAHGRDHHTHAELGLDDDGSIRGLRVETEANVGGYALGGGAAMPGWYGSLLSVQYDIPAISCETRAVFTNTAPVHSYRGAGRPEANYVTERMVGAAARELGFDPAELRRRNQFDPDEFPLETAAGATYDSGDYEPAMDAALDAIGYEAHCERVAGADGPVTDDEGRLVGVGFACYVESTGGGYESGVVRAHPDGTVTVSAGTHSHGQGHETTYAQIVADELGVPYEDIDVREGDSDGTPTGTGTFGSRSTITGGNAVAESAREVREKARHLAAAALEVDPADVEHDDSEFRVSGTERSVSFADVAGRAYGWGVPDGLDPGLESTAFYEQAATAYTFGTHAARVAVDPETGDVAVERYVAVDDCGERINPLIVEGQVHGGVAQGLGQALSEEAVYADNGNLRTASLQDYAVPKSLDVPEIETEATVTPSPVNDLGVKGIGEAGTIAAPPTIVDAVLDALAPLGSESAERTGNDERAPASPVEHLDMPLTAEAVWSAVREARE